MNPFGNSITTEDIIDSLSFFDTWEERYKYIIDLGKELPEMDPSLKSDESIVKGCQSQVWLVHSIEDGKLQFQADSDAFIVKGLLGLVLSAYNNKTLDEAKAFDIEGYFEELNLLKHLSPSRGNGLRAMVKRIQSIADAA